MNEKRLGTWLIVFFTLVVGSLVLSAANISAIGPCPQGISAYVDDNYAKSGAAPRELSDPDVPRLGYILQPQGIEFVLVICVDFPDQDPTTRTIAQINTALFGAAPVSVWDYYDEVSYGQLDFNPGPAPSPVGWFVLPNDMGFYGQDNDALPWPNGLDINRAQFIADALSAADPTVDFSQYDRDGDGVVDHVMLLHEEDGQELGYGYPDDHIWSVSSSGAFGTYDGVNVNAVTVVAENPTQPGLPIGTIAHEFFHDIGGPDLYDYDGGGTPVGAWCLMESGSWLGPYAGGAPGHVCGFLKHDIDGNPGNGIDGWLAEITVAASSIHDVTQIASTVGDRLLRVNFPTNEYFLVENRQQVGQYEQWLPEAGILIWHVDGDIPGGYGFNDGPPTYANYAVWVENPSPLTVNKNAAAYSIDDLQFVFNPLTNPNSDSYDAGVSDVSILVLNNESNVMKVRINPTVSDAAARIELGLSWLANQQSAIDGSWLSNVGTTAMGALAFLNHGFPDQNCDVVEDAIQYILLPAHFHGDGSIHNGWGQTYMTAFAALALFATRNPAHNGTINDARDWLVDSQWDDACIWGSVTPADWYWGGFGYGSSERPDLSNSQFALMALSPKAPPGIPEVAADVWTKAIIFVERCQNDATYNDQAWAQDNTLPSYDDGGFIYHPGASLSTNLRSYGSMTGAGIWSYRLSGVLASDDRVNHALQWVEAYEDCSFDDNPNMLPDSRRFQYYYYMSVAKALAMCDVSQLSGQDWYLAMTNSLAALQFGDGHWVNSWVGHGDEHLAENATVFSLLALQTKVPPPGDLWMSMILESPIPLLAGALALCADLHVYDPENRHLGMNYETGEVEALIPGATLTTDPDGRQVAVFSEIQKGTYHIEIFGLDSCTYSITFEAHRDTFTTSSETFGGDITPGETAATNAVVTSIFGHLDVSVEPPREIPGGLVALCGNESITLTWNPVADALGYKLYYDKDGSGAPYTGTDANEGPSPIDVGNVTSFQLTGLTNDTTYYLALTAYEALGESPYSHEVSCTPSFVQVVEIDIKPQSCPNPLNTKSKGVLPVAILGTEDFDATTVDPATVLLEGVAPLRWNFEDVSRPVDPREDVCDCTADTGDGYLDMTLKFDHREILAALEPVSDGEVRVLTLTGMTIDGVPIEGQDCVVIIHKGPAKLSAETPTEFSLSSNYPNPFNPVTQISYTLPRDGHVKLEIYNLLGQKVTTLVDEYQQAGQRTVNWEAKDFASGIYFYRLSAGDFTATKKMVLTK